MRFPAVALVWAFCTLQTGCFSVPTATIRSPFGQDGNSFERRRDRGSMASPSRPSYLIYDEDVNSLQNSQDRPQILHRPRPWHLEFNKQNQPSHQHSRYQPQQQQQPSQTSPSYTNDNYQPVYSNLIQVLYSPRKYYGPYDSKSYREPEMSFYNYPRYVPRPSDVPRYEIVYPYDNQPKNQFYGENLPDRFPTTFMPDKNFKMKDPPPQDGFRGVSDIGFHRTQTVNYLGNTYNEDGGEDRRGGRREQCNYIKLNEKGFPRGNELCGRSISDMLLAPDYATTGDLAMEHRKRYRGVQQGRSLDIDRAMEEEKLEKNKTEEGIKTRKKRSAQLYQSRFFDRCCDGSSRVNRPYEDGGYGGNGNYENSGGGYGYSSYNGFANRGNGYRPYGRGGDHGFGYGGQYQDNYRDDFGDESSSRGLTAFMSQSDRNRGRGQQDSEENDDGNSYSHGSFNQNSRGRNSNNTQKTSHENRNHNLRNSQNNSRDSGSRDSESEYGSNNGNLHGTAYMRGRDGDYFGSHNSGGSQGFGGSGNTGYDSSYRSRYGSRGYGDSFSRRGGSDESGFYGRYPAFKK